MKKKLVSVVMPTYNRGYIIKMAIDSILNQTYKNLELIIVDDCSNDNTKEIISKYDDNRLKYIRLSEKKGANYARNIGIEKSKGEYITFQDSDDYSFPERLQKEYEYLIAQKVDLVFSSFYKVHDYNENEFKNIILDKIKKTIYPSKKIEDDKIFDTILYKNVITTQVLFAKKEIFLEEKFDNNITRFQDWDLMIRIAKKYKLSHLNIPLLYLFIQKDSITKSYSKGSESLKIILKKYEDYFNRKQKCRILFRIGTFQMMENKDATPYFKKGLKNYKNLEYCLIYILYKIHLYKKIYIRLKK